MIITGNAMQLGGTSGTGNGGGLTTVKTDGTTITGDGNTTPLALGPGVLFGVGSYIWARTYVATNIYRSILRAGQLFSGRSDLQLIYLTYEGLNSVPATDAGNVVGTWRYIGPNVDKKDIVALFQRVA